MKAGGSQYFKTLYSRAKLIGHTHVFWDRICLQRRNSSSNMLCIKATAGMNIIWEHHGQLFDELTYTNAASHVQSRGAFARHELPHYIFLQYGLSKIARSFGDNTSNTQRVELFFNTNDASALSPARREKGQWARSKWQPYNLRALYRTDRIQR